MRILSIDGGGIRGVIPASVLAEVERAIQDREGPDARLIEYFDLVVGTSIGGLLGGLLLIPERAGSDSDGFGERPAMSADDVLQFLVTNGSMLFDRTLRDKVLRLGGLADERYGGVGFNRVLDIALGPAGHEPSLSQLLRPTVIASYNATGGTPYFFKQHRTGEAGARDFNLRDVALATSAAPTFFEPPNIRSEQGDLGACVDGGLFANNPAMCAYAEARGYFKFGATDMAVLSIGTGSVRHTYEHGKMRNWGLMSWIGPLLEMIMSGSSAVVDYQIKQIFASLGDDASCQYLRLQPDLQHETPGTAKMDNVKPANMRRLVRIGQELAHEHRDAIGAFIDTQLTGPLDDDAPPRPDRARATIKTVTRPATIDAGSSSATGVPTLTTTNTDRPSKSDRFKIKALTWMRSKNHEVVDEGSVADFRQRHVPTSPMPQLTRACAAYPNMRWAPKELMVPSVIPPEGRLTRAYKTRYYGLAKFGFKTYARYEMQTDVPWDPDFEWNRAFPPTGDGWEHPTADTTFARLRLQGPNPWLLHRVDDAPGPDGKPEPTFKLDFTDLFDGVLPPIVAWFAVRDGTFCATSISVGSERHAPGDPTWDQAKRVVNAADIRYVVFGRHLLGTHWIVGQAYALGAYSLPTWHPLRPFMQFFTYATLEVNDIAYQSLVTEGSYWIKSGFATVRDADKLFANLIPQFDLDAWIAPSDIDGRGLDAIPDHPYAEDASLVWPKLVAVVERHLDDLNLDDAAISADQDLQSWYLTFTGLIPNTDPRTRPLDRSRLGELCAILLWNNVVHEVCGDMSPILGSLDPLDKAIINLSKLQEALGTDCDLTNPIEPASMSDVFLMDQASYVSRFNVGGNNILRINAARMVDDPKLRVAIEDFQATLTRLDDELMRRNDKRSVRFARMMPQHWEASISF